MLILILMCCNDLPSKKNRPYFLGPRWICMQLFPSTSSSRWFDQRLWWETCALTAVCIWPLPWNGWFCCTWGGGRKPPPGNLGVLHVKTFFRNQLLLFHKFFRLTYLYTSHSLSRSFLLMSWWGTLFIAAQVSLYFSLYTFPKQPCASVPVEYAIQTL